MVSGDQRYYELHHCAAISSLIPSMGGFNERIELQNSFYSAQSRSYFKEVLSMRLVQRNRDAHARETP